MAPDGVSSGRVEVITGCMFSGKTDELIRRLERAEIAGHSVKVYKPSIDDRYSETAIGAHNGREWEAEVVDSAEEVDEGIEDDVVAFDEANFFSDELVEIGGRLADRGVRVIVSGLDTDFRGRPFNPVHSIIARAEYVDKLKAICVKCGDLATRTQRIIDGVPAHEDDPTIVVGADEKYEARCRSCHELKTE
jgi:thymidine kinase